jgi:hypothetical protein
MVYRATAEEEDAPKAKPRGAYVEFTWLSAPERLLEAFPEEGFEAI